MIRMLIYNGANAISEFYGQLARLSINGAMRRGGDGRDGNRTEHRTTVNTSEGSSSSRLRTLAAPPANKASNAKATAPQAFATGALAGNGTSPQGPGAT